MYDPNAPRREYKAKGSKIERCEACKLPTNYCLCDYFQQNESSVGFLLITHHKEQYKPTNTGRLIHKSFTDSWTYIWNRYEPDSSMLNLLNHELWQPYIVFPHDQPGYEDRVITDPEIVKNGKRPLLILLDGTWRQARRMFRQSEFLKQIPVLSVDIQGGSSFELRQAAKEGQLCTAEATAILLEKLGDQDSANHLMECYDRFNRFYSAARQSVILPEMKQEGN